MLSRVFTTQHTLLRMMCDVRSWLGKPVVIKTYGRVGCDEPLACETVSDKAAIVVKSKLGA